MEDNLLQYTMACVSEAIGLALPGSAGTPAVYETRDKFAVSSGHAVMNLLEKNIRPRDIVTRKIIRKCSSCCSCIRRINKCCFTFTSNC